MTDDDPFDDLNVTDDPLDDLDRATQRLTVRTESRRYDKPVTIVEGFEGGADVDALASDLKSMLGAGGTVKEGAIEIQGDHGSRVRDELRDRGYRIDG
ncbi:SUI1 family translation initiation factor [Halostella litorea]|uniref:translation initiation factor n=1 Tax=Halostella litorea TaxID=2528831 RepID=UPI00192A6C5D|nr:translation initiation factor [Halostella litorea]